MKKFFLLGLFICFFLLLTFSINNNYLSKNNLDQLIPNKTEKVIENSEQKSIEVLATNLEIPWSLSFLPTGEIIFTERTGKLKLLSKNGVEEIDTISDVKTYGEGGLMGIAIDPDFQTNNYLYLMYTYSGNGENTLNRVVRYNFKSGSLSNRKIIIDEIPGAIYHNGGSIKFGPDGFLYITTGDAQVPSYSQDKNSLSGKILRVDQNGNPAPENPFNNRVYSYGHRNPQGITWDENKILFETEHGPSGLWPNCCQDEVNKIESGRNYGWPSFFGDKTQDGITTPLLHSGRDVWAPAGLAYYKGKLYFGGLRGSSLYELDINNKKLKTYFKNQFGRIRDVVLGPDQMLYVTTSNHDGRGNPTNEDDRIIKIDPEQL